MGLAGALMMAASFAPIRQAVTASLVFVAVPPAREMTPPPAPAAIAPPRVRVPPPSFVIALTETDAITLPPPTPRLRTPPVQTGSLQTAAYIVRVSAALAAVKRYPLSARRAHQEGVAVLALRLSRSGELMSARLDHSAGYNALDKEALEMAYRAAPFPPFLPHMAGDSLNVAVPIAFSLSR